MVHCPARYTDGGHRQQPLIREAFLTIIYNTQSVTSVTLLDYCYYSMLMQLVEMELIYCTRRNVLYAKS